MKTSFVRNPLTLALIFGFLLASCASAPQTDPRMVALQQRLMTLEANAELASRGGQALKRAKGAVDELANPPRKWNDDELAYRFYSADRLIGTAEMTARTQLAEDSRKALLKEQESLVLEARTLEADRARQAALTAQRSAAEAVALREQALAEAAEAERLRDEARLAQSIAEQGQLSAESAAESARLLALAETERAEQARAEAEAAKAEMEIMRSRLSELEAKQTERGLLITLGDVLFELNQSDLKPGSARNLLPLANVLIERPDQTLIIEGHTDSTGARDYNMTLSEKRAQAVAQYLIEQGVDVNAISTTGLGPDFPVADNGSSAGRQRNRRVDVILPNLTQP